MIPQKTQSLSHIPARRLSATLRCSIRDIAKPGRRETLPGIQNMFNLTATMTRGPATDVVARVPASGGSRRSIR